MPEILLKLFPIKTGVVVGFKKKKKTGVVNPED
jgi:hypothetical protein